MVARRGAVIAWFLPPLLLWLVGSGAFSAPRWEEGYTAHRAMVKAPKIKVNGDMAFGEVMAGAAFRLDPMVDGAGAFEVDGEKGSEVLLAFILPWELIGPGESTVPISFGEADAILSPDKADPESGWRFDPRIPITYISPEGKGKAYVWLGATVSPSFSVRAGEYEGTIVIEASYTGN